MIHGSSSDPVLIKKIALRIWTLRDEVEAILATRLEHEKDAERLEIQALKDEYKPKALVKEGEEPEGEAAGGLNLVEDEEAEGEENPEEEGEEQEASAEGEESPEAEGEAPAESVEQPEEEDDGKVLVFQRTPKIPQEKIINGRTLLQEIYMDRMYFFCNQQFLEGQSIVIEFMVPKKFIVNADIIYCRPYSMKSRIISANKLPYRVAVQFTYLKEGERTLLRNFIESVEVDTTQVKPTNVKPKAAAEDDDFDELDDLDL